MLTGIEYDVLIAEPHYNPDVLQHLQDSKVVDALLQKYAANMPEIIKLRNRILQHEGFDFFKNSTTVSPAWVRQADTEYQRVIRVKDDSG